MAEVKKAKQNVGEMEISTSELAAIVGKTSRWIRQLTSEKVLIQSKKGKYLLADAVQAYILHVSGGAKEDGKPTFTDHKTEHERIKAEKAALELAEMQGNMHSSDDVKAIMGDIIITAKTKLLAIPQRVSLKLDKEPSTVIEKTLTREIAGALAGLTEYSPSLFSGKVGEEDGSEED
jgi:phage terminase Nu1 subunit (DNA packaging protein)